MFFDLLMDAGNYDERKVGRTDVEGLTISTAYTSDEGYETAILDELNAHPVERYKTREEAVIGHSNWCERASDKALTEITVLGGFNGLVKNYCVTLKRKEALFI